MEKSSKIIYTTISVLAVIITLATLLSIFRNTDNRFLKMIDFGRIQLFIASGVSLGLFVLFTRKWRWYDYALIAGLLGGMVTNGHYLINYTSLVAPAVLSVGTERGEDTAVSIMLANVKMPNRTSEPLIELVNRVKPDLLLAMEVDSWWNDQLGKIEAEYPYVQKQINEQAYGMSLYSKLPLTEVEVSYLQNKQVPSMEGMIELRNGKSIVFHSVHPVPPTYFEKFPDNAGQQEIAMLKVGEKVSKRQLPTIVAGDINDVVWSYTDELTGTKDLLHDVRVGRGFYSSFNAHNWLMRWPLDHVFVTKEFRLKKLKRLTKIGSDHFPIYVELVL